MIKLIQILGILALAVLLSHWLVGGQQEIVDREYAPVDCKAENIIC